MGQTSGLTLPQFWINVDLKYQFWISQPLFCCFIHSGTGAFISYQENSNRIALGCFVLVQLWSEGRSFCPYSLLTRAEVKKKIYTVWNGPEHDTLIQSDSPKQKNENEMRKPCQLANCDVLLMLHSVVNSMAIRLQCWTWG